MQDSPNKTIHREKANVFKAVFFTVISLIIFYIVFLLSSILLTFIIYLLFMGIEYITSIIPILKPIFSWINPWKDNPADWVIICCTAPLAYSATKSFIGKRKNTLTSNLTYLITGILLIIFNILFIIINLKYSDSILINLVILVIGALLIGCREKELEEQDEFDYSQEEITSPEEMDESEEERVRNFLGDRYDETIKHWGPFYYAECLLPSEIAEQITNGLWKALEVKKGKVFVIELKTFRKMFDESKLASEINLIERMQNKDEFFDWTTDLHDTTKDELDEETTGSPNDEPILDKNPIEIQKKKFKSNSPVTTNELWNEMEKDNEEMLNNSNSYTKDGYVTRSNM